MLMVGGKVGVSVNDLVTSPEYKPHDHYNIDRKMISLILRIDTNINPNYNTT